jgi:hypothetical protein
MDLIVNLVASLRIQAIDSLPVGAADLLMCVRPTRCDSMICKLRTSNPMSVVGNTYGDRFCVLSFLIYVSNRNITS